MAARLSRRLESVRNWKRIGLKSLGIIVLLALAAFAYGLYADITMTRCVRGSVTAMLGMCAKGD
ncbi:hypothetical protein ACTZWT_01735 [Rhodopseudomonas sp. NSM]|uniref:hypothetical protein n=1 Tax=Rhodopseudomonas sp. NSM TaxID=3457630 RepID=UPI00403652B2